MQSALPAALATHIAVVARQLAGRRRVVDRRDLEQEAYLRCLTARRRFDGRASLATFLRAQVPGAMLDSLRRTNFRGKGRWRPLTKTLTARLVSGTPSPDGHVLALELRACVNALPWREAYVLQGLYFDEARYRDLAHELGISVAQVWHLRKLGLERLRRLL